MTVLDTAVDPRDPAYLQSRGAMLQRLADLETALDVARGGGGEKAVTRHHARASCLPRERVEMLLDSDSPFLELSPGGGLGFGFPGRRQRGHRYRRRRGRRVRDHRERSHCGRWRRQPVHRGERSGARPGSRR
jgi:hypothetical protein